MIMNHCYGINLTKSISLNPVSPKWHLVPVFALPISVLQFLASSEDGDFPSVKAVEDCHNQILNKMWADKSEEGGQKAGFHLPAFVLPLLSTHCLI